MNTENIGSKKISVNRRVNNILRRAIRLIGLGWTKGSYARTAGVNAIPYTAPEACQFCSLGAIYRAAIDLGEDRNGNVTLDARAKLRKVIAAVYGENDIVEFNDSPIRKKEEVLAAFKKAVDMKPAKK